MSDDPVPDIEPEGSSVSNLPSDNTPIVSSANSYFVYILTMFGILIYYRVAWKAVDAIIFENSVFLKGYSSILFYMWLVPIVGLVTSIVNPSLGATGGWTTSILIIGAVPLCLAFPYVLWFGIKPPAAA